ncbi:MAG: hypothetical protein LLG16_03865, partial [Euryarchaeota archaeon]|nr:hypothetical protein [Euryarchaeota archaeon]
NVAQGVRIDVSGRLAAVVMLHGEGRQVVEKRSISLLDGDRMIIPADLARNVVVISKKSLSMRPTRKRAISSPLTQKLEYRLDRTKEHRGDNEFYC